MSDSSASEQEEAESESEAEEAAAEEGAAMEAKEAVVDVDLSGGTDSGGDEVWTTMYDKLRQTTYLSTKWY
jgi:hypothetical protein